MEFADAMESAAIKLGQPSTDRRQCRGGSGQELGLIIIESLSFQTEHNESQARHVKVMNTNLHGIHNLVPSPAAMANNVVMSGRADECGIEFQSQMVIGIAGMTECAPDSRG